MPPKQDIKFRYLDLIYPCQSVLGNPMSMMGYESNTISPMSVEGTSATTASGPGPSTTTIPPKTRPHRPCDACRKRKSRCELPDGDSICVLCTFHKQPCTFIADPPKKKRRNTSEGPVSEPKRAVLRANSSSSGGVIVQPLTDINGAHPSSSRSPDAPRRDSTAYHPPVKDYADLRGPSLLKRTLGLQNHRHSALLGPTSVYESRLLTFDPSRNTQDISLTPSSTLRKVGQSSTFLLTADAGTRNHEQEHDDLDAIESIVHPHGQALINLYFRIVHPTFPILHKKVYLEKYARSHREFSPPLLAAVYILALNWWSYSTSLSLLPKPDAGRLEDLAFKAMADVVHRPKLSTIQAGLLLLQRPEGDTWALTTQIVGLAQELGLHLDCTDWRVPDWEKGLRKRLAWAVYMQDKWGSLVHGRPSHVTADEWDVRPLTESDFPESAADEDDEEGSTEVEKGRVLFCEMIALTGILADVLREFYTVRAEREMLLRTEGGGLLGWVLQRAKPLQLRLKSWFADLPECLRLQDVAVRKLSSTGYLHLAYYAAEITLHRRIVQALEGEKNPELVRVCRVAARERLVNVLEFVNRLRPEHLQSFWYSASEYNFALVGTFIALLWATASSAEDAAWFRGKGDEYRWTLRLSSKNAEILGRAIALIALSAGVLGKAVPDAGHGIGVVAGTEGRGPGSVARNGQGPEATAAAAATGGYQGGGQDDLSSVSVVSPVTSYEYGREESESLPLDTSQIPWFEDGGGFETDLAGNLVFGVDSSAGHFLGYSEL